MYINTFFLRFNKITHEKFCWLRKKTYICSGVCVYLLHLRFALSRFCNNYNKNFSTNK